MVSQRLRSIIQKLEVPHEGGVLPDRWINNDIKPIEAARRTWGSWTFHLYWVLINCNISTYITGSSLVAIGLTWWQAIIAIVIGNLLATAFVVLNSLPGAYYHIGFPIVNRYVWGMYGSAFTIWNRILLSIVWYGYQSWLGGECIYVMLKAIWPSIEQRIPNHIAASTGTTSAYFLTYAIFMIISLPFVWIRPHKLDLLFRVTSAVVGAFFLILLFWSVATMGKAGFGDTISSKSSVVGASVGWNIAFGIISTIGSISAGILNQNDYARFARRPRDAIMGQLFSFPLYGILCSVIGILVTAATQKRYGGEALWNVSDLMVAVIENGGSRSRAAAFFAGLALVVSQIAVNVPGNSLSGGFDFAATFPKFINIRRGAYLTVILSVACNPWKLVNTATIFLTVLSSYAVFLGPMTGLMISSYLVVNRRKIKVDDLFVGNSTSIYWYTLGINWRAFVAWTCGTAPSLPGFVSAVNTSANIPEGLIHLYDICFLSGAAISSFVYIVLHYAFPAKEVQHFVRDAPAADVLIRMSREEVDARALGEHGVQPGLDEESEGVVETVPKLG